MDQLETSPVISLGMGYANERKGYIVKNTTLTVKNTKIDNGNMSETKPRKFLVVYKD